MRLRLYSDIISCALILNVWVAESYSRAQITPDHTGMLVNVTGSLYRTHKIVLPGIVPLYTFRLSVFIPDKSTCPWNVPTELSCCVKFTPVKGNSAMMGLGVDPDWYKLVIT